MDIPLEGLRRAFHSAELDRAVHLVRSGRPHENPIAHLASSHSAPATANYLLSAALLGEWDVPLDPILGALEGLLDKDPASVHYGCFRWYLEGPAVVDANAGFFVTGPLVCLDLLYGRSLAPSVHERLHRLLRATVPHFLAGAAAPTMHYPNAHLGVCVVLLALGRCLDEADLREKGRQACWTTLDYWDRRGWGWGENHSAVYGTLLVAELWMILHLEPRGPLHELARRLLDHLLDFFAFHDGYEPVPAIRSYNFDGRVRCPSLVNWVLGRSDEAPDSPWYVAAYRLGGRRENRPEPTVPRRIRRPLFGGHYSTSYVGAHARLGTISRYPEMPESYMTDTWGLGWQSFPVSFIAADHDLGALCWVSCDDQGVTRWHPGRAVLEFDNRCLFPRLSFHPQVITISHQVDGAAIVLREVHRLHTRLRWLEDCWTIHSFSGRLVGPSGPWDGQPAAWEDPGWLALEHEHVTVGLRPLACLPAGRVRGTPIGPADRHFLGTSQPPDHPGARRPVVQVRQEGQSLHLALRLAEHDGSEFLAKFLCGGWCVVLVDTPEDLAHWSVEDRLFPDGEQARPGMEWVHAVTLSGPAQKLTLRRDPLEIDGVRT